MTLKSLIALAVSIPFPLSKYFAANKMQRSSHIIIIIQSCGLCERERKKEGVINEKRLDSVVHKINAPLYTCNKKKAILTL